MSKQPTHDVLLAENYEKDGQQKSYFTNIGSAWQSEKGAISVQMRDGLSVSGRFIILPKGQGEDSAVEAFNEQPAQ